MTQLTIDTVVNKLVPCVCGDAPSVDRDYFSDYVALCDNCYDCDPEGEVGVVRSDTLEGLVEEWADYVENERDYQERVKKERATMQPAPYPLPPLKVEDCSSCEHKHGPSHYGSPRCQSGSLASGGRHSHCSCDTCF